MDESKCKSWVEKNLYGLMREFGIPHWKVTVAYTTLNGDAAADCDPCPLYEHAHIRVDAAKFSEKSLPRIIEHELLHVVAASWTAFWPVCYEALGGVDTPTTGALRRLEHQTNERNVKALERLVYGLRHAKK